MLENKVAIVTGAGQGIGKGIALALAKEGAKVAVSDITDKIDEGVSEIKEMGFESMAIKADVSDSKSTQKMVGDVLKNFGSIDILVNNAGIYPFKPLAEMTEDDWDKVIGINLKGVFNCTKAVLETMKKQKAGNVVNIASIAGAFIGYENLAHYSASKGGILGFTRSAALELAKDGIRVNAIAPGAILTPRTQVMGDEVIEQIKASNPLNIIGTPEDIANLVVFLASDRSRYITGQCIVSDGGLVIK